MTAQMQKKPEKNAFYALRKNWRICDLVKKYPISAPLGLYPGLLFWGGRKEEGCGILMMKHPFLIPKGDTP